MKKEKDSAYKKHIDKLVKPIFEKALQERKPNSMTTTSETYKIFWRPNNYRRKIQIKTRDNSTMQKIGNAIGSAIKKKDFTYNEHTKLVFIKNYNGITIQLGKNTITGIYSQKIIEGKKEIYLIKANSTEDLEERITQIKQEIKEKIDNSLRIFCKEFDAESISTPMWDRYEDFIKGEDFIDKIPVSTIIHDTYFKKVYGQGIEFKQTEDKEDPTVNLKNYIVNQATKRHSPEIAKSIETLGDALLNKLNPAIEKLTEQITVHLAVQESSLKTQKSTRNTLKDISHTLKEKPTQNQKTTPITHYNHKSLKSISLCGREISNLKITNSKANCKVCINRDRN